MRGFLDTFGTSLAIVALELPSRLIVSAPVPAVILKVCGWPAGDVIDRGKAGVVVA